MDLVSDLADTVCIEGEPACPACPLRDTCPTGQEFAVARPIAAGSKKPR